MLYNNSIKNMDRDLNIYNGSANKSMRRSGLAVSILAAVAATISFVAGNISYIMVKFDTMFFYEGMSGLDEEKIPLFVAIIGGYLFFVIALILGLVAIHKFKKATSKPIATLAVALASLYCSVSVLPPLFSSTFSVVELAIKLYFQ